MEKILRNVSLKHSEKMLRDFPEQFIIYLENYKKLLWKLQKILEKFCVSVDTF